MKLEDISRISDRGWREIAKYLLPLRRKWIGISTRLGLKGRADALFYDEGKRRTILELKSGKVPVDAHMLQLYAYSLLFADQAVNLKLMDT